MPTSDDVEPRLPAGQSVSHFMRTLDVYPVVPPHKAHETTVRPQGNAGGVSPRPCNHRTSQRQREHAWRPSCMSNFPRTPAAAAATGASPSSPTPSSVAEKSVKEAAYRLSPQEVQRRAQQVLTAQIRSLLEARLQERLHQARVAQAQWEATRRPSPSAPVPPPVPPCDTHMASAWPASASSEAAVGASTAPASAEPEPSFEEVSPLITTTMSAHGSAAGGATTRQGVTSAASAAHSTVEMPTIDVHPYSAVELVRVHRLRGVPNHNRGLFAGLSKRTFTTRSGQYTVGREGEGHRRVRSGVSGFMWEARRHSGAASGPPPRLTMRFLCTDSQMLFQWTEDADSAYAVQGENEEFDSRPDDGPMFCNASCMDDPSLGHGLKGVLEHMYGKRMTTEQRAEAVRRLRERREGRRGTSNRYPMLDGKDSNGDGHSSIGGGATTDSTSSLLAGVKDGSSGLGESGHEGRTPSNKGSRSGVVFSNMKHSLTPLHVLSPTKYEQDHLLPLADTPMLGASAMPHNCSDPPLALATPGYRISVSADGGCQRRSAGADTWDHPLLATLSLSSLSHTMTTDEAEAHRLKRNFYVAVADSRTRSRSGGGDGSVRLWGMKGRVTGAGGDHGTYGSPLAPHSASRPSILSVPSSGGQRSQVSNTVCLDMEAETTVVDGRPSTAAGGPHSGTHDTSLVDAGTSGDNSVTGGLGSGGRYDTRRNGEGVSLAAGQGTGEEFTGKEMKQHTLTPFSAVSLSATATSAQDSSLRRPRDDDDSRNLDEFLIHFPEEADHVRLRRTAKNILDGMEDMWDDDGNSRSAFLLPQFLNPNFQFPGLDDTIGAADGADGCSGHGEGSEDNYPPLTGFGVNDAELNEKFRIEAEEEYSDLIAQRDALLAEVEGQHQLLGDMGADVHYLSVGQARTGMNAEQYAITLTSEVNRYAKLHRLCLNRTLEERSQQQQGDEADAAVEHAADGFLDRFGKERTATADVGSQVCDADLCYVDAAVRSTEEQLEDLFLHEKALVNAVRLATVAVANIMTFHASLEMESTCHECFFVFDKPQTLWPCGHTFCLSCLSNMYNRRGKLICAECGSVCEVGYTPNISVELIANYQTVCRRSEADADVEPDSALAKERETQTIEGVLRSLLNDLLSAQSSWTASPLEHSPLRLRGGA
ncbi:putative RING-type zinc-finger/Zinc finger, C3HC4 type (RING finger) containing protein [Leishmania shawi]|uniref:RING-type zinc-finger/Zinc finger, C3HC4 type (RING finger) containing protein n=1 Tax=Leishmania shawi TaxID=5680 RepID=A0AAW3BW99_9TRYP